MKKLTILFITAVLLATTTFAQQKKDSALLFMLSHTNELDIGLSGGPNYTYAKPPALSPGLLVTPEPSSAVAGIHFEATLQYKLPQKFFISTGITYQDQNYRLNNKGGYDYPFMTGVPPQTNAFNNNDYNCYINSYYISIPLSFGYYSTKNRITTSFSFGFEFYANYKNHVTIRDMTKDTIIDNNIFYTKSHNAYWGWDWAGDFVNFNWAPFSVLGILNLNESYKVTPRVYASMGISLRFNNILGINYNPSTFGATDGIMSASINFGLSYSFDVDNIGSFLLPDKEKEVRKTRIGFHVSPTFFSENDPQTTQPRDNGGLSLCYDLSIQFHLSNRLAFETGIALDNYRVDLPFNFASIGLPVILKYYFHPKKDDQPTYFIGAGVHLDCLNNFDFAWWYSENSFDNILPVAILEAGADYSIGNDYFLNVTVGGGHWLKGIHLSGPVYFDNDPTQFYIFSSVGISYKF